MGEATIGSFTVRTTVDGRYALCNLPSTTLGNETRRNVEVGQVEDKQTLTAGVSRISDETHDARAISRLLGLIEREPTGSLTVMAVH
jgi:hypothetical protein